MSSGSNLSTAETLKILLIEDNPGDEELLRIQLRSYYGDLAAITSAKRVSEAISALRRDSYHLVLYDITLPDSSPAMASQVIQELRQYSTAAIIILTGFDNVRLALETANVGAQDYLLKEKIDWSRFFSAVGLALVRNKNDILKTKLLLQLEDDLKKLAAIGE